MAAGFVMPLVLIRVMSQSDYGVFSQFITIFTVMYMMLGAGIHANLFYFYPTSERRGVCVGNTLFLLLAACVFFAWFMLPPAQRLLFGESDLSAYGSLVVLCFLLAIPLNMVSPLAIVREDKLLAVLLPGGFAFARIAVVVCAMMWWGSLKAVFVSLVVFQGAVFALVVVYALMEGRLSIDRDLMRRQLSYALPFGVAAGLQLLLFYFDKLLCVRYVTSVDYAIYCVAFMSIPGVNQVCDSLCQVNIVNMTKCHQANEAWGVVSNYHGFVTKTLSFATPLILSVCVFSEEIMGFLFTERDVGSAPFFRLYSLTSFTAVLGAGTILSAVGKTRLAMRSFVISCIIGIPATWLLIYTYGIYGAIWGAMININLPRFIQMYYDYRSLHVGVGDYLPWSNLRQILLWGVLLVVPAVVLKVIFSPNIIWCFVCCCLYVLAAYYVYVRKEVFIFDRKTIESYCRRILR